MATKTIRLRDHDGHEVVVTARTSSVLNGGSLTLPQSELPEAEARKLHTFLHRAFPTGNEVKRSLGLVSDHPVIAEEEPHPFGATAKPMWDWVRTKQSRADFSPIEWDFLEYYMGIVNDLLDKGRVVFAEHPCPAHVKAWVFAEAAKAEALGYAP